ncbi:MAG: cobalt ECF transporter T component CbiQ [Candidatus Bathyarchaeota archaeon]|nr:cobalt ECF transporter T component CbiQ [Candidatus Bathyarchaeota archaeon]
MNSPTSLKDLLSSVETIVYIEDLSGKKGFLQSINPLVKLAVTVLMIVVSLFVYWLPYLLLLCAIPVVLAIASKIPLKGFMARTFFMPLFAVVISVPILFITQGNPVFSADLGLLTLTITLEGLTRFLTFSIRVWFCVASLTLFTLSTGFDAIMQLLAEIRVPSVIVQMFSLTYRYLFVSIHELQKVLIAKEARTYVNKRTLSIASLKHSGALLATLFIRTYERSERVYLAMKSRGFNINNNYRSSFPTLRSRDILFGVSATVAFGLLVLL